MRIILRTLVEQPVKYWANLSLLRGWCSHASLLCLPHETMVQKVCKILMNQGTRSCHHFTQAELTAQAAGQWRIKPAGFAWEDAPQSWKMDLETSDELCKSAMNENHCW